VYVGNCRVPHFRYVTYAGRIRSSALTLPTKRIARTAHAEGSFNLPALHSPRIVGKRQWSC